MTPLIAVALLCFILPACVAGAFVFASGLRYRRTFGTVVGEDVVGNDTDQMSAPIVEFETPDGRKIVFTEKVHSNETLLDTIGNLAKVFVLKKDPTKVRVLYDPNDPQKARVNNFGNLYFFPLVLFIFGLFVILYTIPGFEDLFGKLTAFLDKIPF